MMQPQSLSVRRLILTFFTFALILIALTSSSYAAPKVGPVRPEESIVGGHANDQIGSGGVYALPSGNIVILSPNWNEGRGAVTCLTPAEYRAGGIVVSAANSLVGERPGDYVGYDGITILTNGNFVVVSNYLVMSQGAVTWVNGATCVPHGETTRSAVVSASNSLVGSVPGNGYGSMYAVALTNGHYVVGNPYWSNGSSYNVGAATWGNGTTGIAGTVSASNSLIGSTLEDRIGEQIIPLTNGNYVVGSFLWDNGTIEDAGAATWADGSTGITGIVSAQNSLVGTSRYDNVGAAGFYSEDPSAITALSNGNYVVASTIWDNGVITDAGAVTWGDGTKGITGPINAANSLVGVSDYEGVGSVVKALTNGHYVVIAGGWNNGESANVGAAVWANGTTGLTGSISAENALIGSSEGDFVWSDVLPLTNGNYVVSTPNWDKGSVMDAGAATWGNGATGTTGVISVANALTGSGADDSLAAYKALANGHYVVGSLGWDDGSTTDMGAVAWANGWGGTVGTISPANALVGTQYDDTVGIEVVALSNGNYVVVSPYWDDGTEFNVGAVTWGNGLGGTVGPVSVSNSLIGATEGDTIGLTLQIPSDAKSILELTNGHYLVYSYSAQSPDVGDYPQIGAVTWASGTAPTIGTVTASNSTFGALEGRIGLVKPFHNSDYMIIFLFWDRENEEDTGAMVWMDGSGGVLDATSISEQNALVGTKPSEFTYVTWGEQNHTFTLPDGTYIISVPTADNGPLEYAGAVFWSDASLPGQNTPPLLAPIGDFSAQVGEPLSFDAEAIDPDQPAESLTFSIAGAPTGSAFIPATGLFTWTPTEADAGQTFNVTVGVIDDGAPQGVDSETFAIAVTDGDGNTPPALASIGPRIGYAGKTLRFIARATDPDQPVQTLTFSLGADAPVGATIDPLTGQFAWPISADQTPGVAAITVTVTDDGAPAESASETFAVRVEAANALANYGFEAKGKTEARAAGWVGNGLTKNDRRACNTEANIVAHEGRCAYRFQYSGANKPARMLGRALNINGFVKGDVLELRGAVKAKNLTAGARVTLRVVYKNNDVKVATFNVTPGNYDYTVFSQTLTLARAVKAASVQIRAGATKGTLFIDDLAVIRNPAAALLVDDGAAGAGLRGVD